MHRPGRGTISGRSSAGSLTGHPVAQRGVRRDATAEHDRAGADLPGGTDRLRGEHVDDGVLEAPRQLGDEWIRERSVGLVREPGLGPGGVDDPPRRGLEPGEAEVVRLTEPGAREDPIARGGRLRRALDRRSARVAEAEQPPDLVEGLAGGIVDGLAEQPIGQVVAHLGEEGVAAGHDERDERERRFGVLGFVRVEQPRRVDVPFEVVHPDQRLVVDPGEGLREVDANEQRSGEPGPVRDGHRLDVVPRHAGAGPRLVQDRHDPAQVGSGRHLRDDAPGRSVERDLGGNDVGVDPPAALDDRDAGLVARQFEGEDERSAHRSPGCGPCGSRSAAGRSASPSGSPGRRGSGAASSSARSRVSRSRIRGSASGSVVMISASSLSSL